MSPEDEEITCCHRATFCCPTIRDILVTRPVIKYIKQVTWANVFWFVTVVAMTLMGYATLYFLIGEQMLPGGDIFGFFVLVVFAYALGWSLAYIPYLNLPPVFGMLLAGIIFRNTDFYDVRSVIGSATSTKIRVFCFTFIAMRAGLQLTTSPLRENPAFVVNLAFVPCSIEMIVVSVCCRYILEYPWSWAFLTGTIIACMSSVVTVNCSLALAEQGYGEDKGIATLLCTATSIDDVHIVSLFSICYSSVFSDIQPKTQWWAQIPGGIRDFVLGFLAGSFLGMFFSFFPHRSHKHVFWYRIGGLTLGALMCTTAASKVAITGGGFLTAVVMSFVASTCWRLLTVSFDVTPLRRASYYIWHFMQPVLVGVIGTDIDFNDWSFARFGLYVVCIVIGLIARSIFAFLATFHAPFNTKERIFIALSWLPKGTIQAALAPMALEQARMNGEPTEMELAIDVVRLSVVAIVFLAPLGSIIMMVSGPALLNRITEEEHRRHREISYLKLVGLQSVFGKRRQPETAPRTTAQESR